MNSYSDSGYQEISSFHNSQNLNKAELRQQHSLGGALNSHDAVRSSRAEGQASAQVLGLGTWAGHLGLGTGCSSRAGDSSCIAGPPLNGLQFMLPN